MHVIEDILKTSAKNGKEVQVVAGRHKAVAARRKRPAKFFLTMCLIWHTINEPECKAELNFDNFQVENVALMACV